MENNESLVFAVIEQNQPTQILQNGTNHRLIQPLTPAHCKRCARFDCTETYSVLKAMRAFCNKEDHYIAARMKLQFKHGFLPHFQNSNPTQSKAQNESLNSIK